MSANFKNALLIIVAVLGVILIGLFFYEKTVDEKIAQDENSFQGSEQEDIKLSEPTGKTEDILNSALTGISAEVDMEKDEDSLAKNALDDEKEVSDFSTAYENISF